MTKCQFWFHEHCWFFDTLECRIKKFWYQTHKGTGDNNFLKGDKYIWSSWWSVSFKLHAFVWNFSLIPSHQKSRFHAIFMGGCDFCGWSGTDVNANSKLFKRRNVPIEKLITQIYHLLTFTAIVTNSAILETGLSHEWLFQINHGYFEFETTLVFSNSLHGHSPKKIPRPDHSHFNVLFHTVNFGSLQLLSFLVLFGRFLTCTAYFHFTYPITVFVQ